MPQVLKEECKKGKSSKTDSKSKKLTPITKLPSEMSHESIWSLNTNLTWKLISTLKFIPLHINNPSSFESRTATMSPTFTFLKRIISLLKRITLTTFRMVLSLMWLKKITKSLFLPVLEASSWESTAKPTHWVHSEKMEKKPEFTWWSKGLDF